MPNVLPLVTLPTKTLRIRSVEVNLEQIATPEFQTFLEALINTMSIEDGLGIAAAQVGRNERIFIINEKSGPSAYINPEIIKISEELQENEEGCLSIPGVWGIVPRAKKIRFKARNRHGRWVEFDTKGFRAAVYQHELDHLNGILFIDKATKIVKGADRIRV